MSDDGVADALRSTSQLVVIEAPGGCGKTFQACQYASNAGLTIGLGRVLVLAHTHAAADVFASRIADRRRVEVRTIDSLAAQIGSAYWQSLDLPQDVAGWTRRQGNKGYKEAAARVAKFLGGSDIVSDALARRYPVVICDEHQDASEDQHRIVMAMHAAGSLMRVFGDPMQQIGKMTKAERTSNEKRWNDLKRQANIYDELDFPHRWDNAGTRRLGEWILKARETLKTGGRLNLRNGLPAEVSVIFADNLAKAHGVYSLSKMARRPVDGAANATPLLVLSAQNETVRSLRPFFNRTIPVWEGHTRDALTTLVEAIEACQGDGKAIAQATVAFIEEIAVGFTTSGHSSPIVNEVATGCTAKRRKKPAALQELGRCILAEPDHRGVSKMLSRLRDLIKNDDAFSDVKIDHPREFREAMLLGEFGTCSEGLTEITRRRTFARPMPPQRALSTVHKAKGLEREHVLVMPCDDKHFADTPAARCLLYVAISRATKSLTLVVPSVNRSPLIAI